MNMCTNRVEQHLIKRGEYGWKHIDGLCCKSNDLYNFANYNMRKALFEDKEWLSYCNLFDICKNDGSYKDIGSNVGQQTLRLLDKNWKSFFKAMKDWKKHPSKYLGMPKPPNYKNKNGRFILGIDNIKFNITDGFIRFSWKPLNCLNDKFKTKISKDSKLLQCRFVPMGVGYMMEIVYEIDVPEIKGEAVNIASIDLGIDNFATIVNNIGLQPIVIKGGVIKSINQYYNKKLSSMRSELRLNNGKYKSKKIQQFTDKHRFKIKNWMHNASKYVVNYCILYGIDTLICGYNETWKQDTNIGKINNQKFVNIPYLMFVNQLKYKCENNGIRFITTEESYTSGTSFLDNEEPTKANYNKRRRIQRGLFKSNNGTLINADVNGAYQIMKKVFPNVLSDGIEGAGLHPRAVHTT
jgi:putative transposase